MAEIQNFGTGIDLLTEAISDKGFPASFERIGNCLQVFSAISQTSQAGSSFLYEAGMSFDKANKSQKTLLSAIEQWVRGQLRDKYDLKDAEIDLVFQYPKDAMFVLTAKQIAENVEIIYFGQVKDGSQENAFRHAYWNALMSFYIGNEKAELFANAHEIQNDIVTITPELRADRAMDLHNNLIGRNIGKQIREMSASDANNLLAQYFDTLGDTQAAMDEYNIGQQELLAMMLVNDQYLKAVQCVYANNQLSSLDNIDFENLLVFLE